MFLILQGHLICLSCAEVFRSANTSIASNPESIVLHPSLRSLRHWLDFNARAQDVEHVHPVYLNETIHGVCRIYGNQIIALSF